MLIPSELWDELLGPKPTEDMGFRSNGCTMSPDRLRSFPFFGRWLVETFEDGVIAPACYLHDFQTHAVSTLDREAADIYFRPNIEKCLSAAKKVPRWLRGAVAWIYFRAVRALGGSRYGGQGDPAE